LPFLFKALGRDRHGGLEFRGEDRDLELLDHLGEQVDLDASLLLLGVLAVTDLAEAGRFSGTSSS
jgi:hypothetical protein